MEGMKRASYVVHYLAKKHGTNPVWLWDMIEDEWNMIKGDGHLMTPEQIKELEKWVINGLAENTNDFVENVKTDIIDRLTDKKGCTHYLCDLGFELTMNENNTGSWYCNEYLAKEDIKNNFELFGLLAEYMHDNLEDNTNPLLESELFHVKAMICLYEMIFNAAVNEFKQWDEEITIDDAFIERVREALKIVSIDRLF